MNIVGRGGYKWAGVNKSGQGVPRVNSKVAKKDLTCPTDTWGPLRDLNANLMTCLLAKMKSMMIVWTPT